MHGTDIERVSDQVSVLYDSETRGIKDLSSRMREVVAQLQEWVNTTRAITGQASLFDRGKYVASDNPYDQMVIARQAVKDDDIVGGIAELTEGLAFQGIKWEAPDWDTTDYFNQMAAEQNLDDVVRKMWREEFAVSQCIVAMWWDWGEFRVRGETDGGNKRRSKRRIWYPRSITVLDPVKIVPVGLVAFGQERLAWKATPNELAAYNAVTLGEYQDELFSRFYSGQYVVRDMDELLALTSLKVDIQRLLLLDGRYAGTR